MAQVERAVFDLRRGLPVVIRGPAGTCLAAPVENISNSLFDEMRQGAHNGPRLILTNHRLAHLGRQQSESAVGLAVSRQDTRTDVIRRAADPAAEWPEDRPVSPATKTEQAAMALVQRGRLLPAALCIEPNESFAHTVEARLGNADILAVTASDALAHCYSEPQLQRVSEAEVPLELAPNARFVVFRETGLTREHLAILIGHPEQWEPHVPVRLHSACLTGDLFGSMRCDCGSQLRTSVAKINKRGGGVLLYLAQEGRGIGLANKLRAYQIQSNGLDTVDADQALGFDQDERHYDVARNILAQLGITHINLLTNNPAKVEALDRDPIHVAGHISIYGRITRQNRDYLTTKAQKAGHWLDVLLAESPDSGH